MEVAEKRKDQLELPCSQVYQVDTPKRKQLLESGVCCTQNACLLGRGSYGIVIKATFQEKPVAVKILDTTHPANSATLTNEANALGWTHANIIEVVDIVVGPNYGVVIMTQSDGECLQTVIECSPASLSAYHQLKISLDVALGLEYCHKNNVMHLDIKPQNVLLVRNATSMVDGYCCKLCDFGSSAQVGNNTDLEFNNRGTIRYMAPEMLQGIEFTTASDIYSFGILLWSLANKVIPYNGLVEEEVAYRVVKHKLRPDSKSAVSNRLRVPDENGIFTSSCKSLTPLKGHITHSSLCDVNSLNTLTPQILSNHPQLKISSTSSSGVQQKRHQGSSQLSFACRELNFNSSRVFAAKRTNSQSVTTALNLSPMAQQLSQNDDSGSLFGCEWGEEKAMNGNTLVVKTRKLDMARIYRKCWQEEADKRFNVQELIKGLNSILKDIEKNRSSFKKFKK